MKALAVVALALALSACSATPKYEHGPDTHERAVMSTVPSWAAHVYQPVIVAFAVEPDGAVSSVYASGGGKHDRRFAIRAVENTSFPPHTGVDPIWYSVIIE